VERETAAPVGEAPNDRHLYRPHPAVQLPGPVPVAAVNPLVAADAVLSAAHTVRVRGQQRASSQAFANSTWSRTDSRVDTGLGVKSDWCGYEDVRKPVRGYLLAGGRTRAWESVMRIGLIAPPWVPVPPQRYGGIEAVVDRLARGLVAAGHEVLLAAPRNSTCPVPQIEGSEEAEEGAPVCSDVNTELRHVLLSYAAMSEVDVIHDHTVVGPLLRRWDRSAPVVTTLHGPLDPKMAPIYRAFRDVSVIAISHHQASTASGVPITRVIHHGLDLVEVPVGEGDGGYATFLGRMSPEKGPREAALIARTAGVPLRMAAKIREPAEREYFESEVRPLLSSDIEYLGELGVDDKFKLLGESFALLNPIQWSEPFGLVMIEALATGTPVVATPRGSAPEIVDHGVTGYLCKDRQSMTKALLDAAQLDRNACRAAACQRFDSRVMVNNHLELYDELVCADSPVVGGRNQVSDMS
jgi:glycosyltransferase involved in cell wall biosynthesis